MTLTIMTISMAPMSSNNASRQNDVQYNNNEHNDTQHNQCQHGILKCETQHKLYCNSYRHYGKCRCAECRSTNRFVAQIQPIIC